MTTRSLIGWPLATYRGGDVSAFWAGSVAPYGWSYDELLLLPLVVVLDVLPRILHTVALQRGWGTPHAGHPDSRTSRLVPDPPARGMP